MTTSEQGPAAGGLIERVKNILFSPAAEWDRIDAEPATIQGLYTGYACILAAIGPAAQLIGSQLFGYHALWLSYRPPLVSSIVGAVVGYILGLVAIFVFALVIDALAPQFGGQKNRIQALKVAIYAATAGWIVGVFQLVPQVSALGIIGVYSLYLLYLGLPKLMKAPQDKALAYTIVSIVVAIVIWVVVEAVSASLIVGVGGMGMFSSANISAPAGGVVGVGGAQVDLGKLQAASKQMEAAANGAATVKAVPGETLKGMLPANIGAGYARSEVSSNSGGVGGLEGSMAEGVYTKGDARVTLTVTDAAAGGALAALGGAFNVQSDQETASGYEKVHLVNGHMVEESWDRESKTGKYGVMVASRFIVEAEGSGADMADLKAAVDAVGIGRLEGLAKG